MKKLLFIATLTIVTIVACNKEIDVKEDSQIPLDSKGDVTITAYAPAETKTTIDGLDVKWATGDHLAVFDEDGGLHDFTLSTGAGTTSGSFSGTLGGKSSLGYAVYPYSINADFDGDVYVDYPSTYAYSAVTVPMWGEEGSGDNVGKYTFHHVGGAFKIRYYNVPATADKFVFTATSDITGTVGYDMTDATVIANGGSEVTVTDLPSSSTLTFIIPVPAGSYSFTVRLKDSGNNDIAGSVKTVSSAKSVSVGHVLPLREVVITPVPNNTVLWSDDFGTFGNSGTTFASITDSYISDYATAKYPGRSGIGDNGYVTLASSGSVIVSTTTTTGMTSGHLWFNKSANGSVTTSAINLYGNTGFTLTYDQANKNSESIAEYSDDGGINWKSLGTQTGPGSATFGVSDLAVSSILIRIRHDGGNSVNTRVDNLVVKAGGPVPYIEVTTSDATSVTSSGATLNGTIALKNGATIGNVSSAGFYYKKTSYVGDYTKVTVSTPLGSTSFSKTLDELDQEEYTFYAFAVYKTGDEVAGSTQTFTPSDSAGTDPVEGVCFNITSYGSVPSGWSSSGVTTGSYFLLANGGYLTSPAYNLSGCSSANVSVKLATYGSGANPTATISVSYDGGETWSETTTETPTSSTYITKSYDLTSSFTNKVVIKLSCSTTARTLRVQNFSFTVE